MRGQHEDHDDDGNSTKAFSVHVRQFYSAISTVALYLFMVGNWVYSKENSTCRKTSIFSFFGAYLLQSYFDILDSVTFHSVE